MLKSGRALPYFIWPNINPFRKEPSIYKAVYDSPETFRAKIKNDKSLNEARKDFKQARIDKIGIFESNIVKPLILEPFELRYLGRKSCPSRWFIDLDSNDNKLHPPVKYFLYPPEDRLFIPDHYVPLFESKGWIKH